MKFPSVRDIAKIIDDSFTIFSQNDPLRLASSTAFFTVFALPPILLILTNVFGIIFNQEIISGEYYEDLQQIFGDDTAYQIRYILENFQDLTQNWYLTIASMIFFTFVSTTLFVVVQKSLNELWNIKPKRDNRRKQLMLQLRHRAIGLAIILCTGLLVLASLVYDTVIAFLGDYLSEIRPQLDEFFVHWAGHAISIVVITIWFAIVFKYLPDAHIPWKAIWVGSIVTGILFEVGKYILGRLLVNGNIATLYGAAGSIVLLLLFIFYSAMILFYGASFTKAYVQYANLSIEPKLYVIEYEIREIPRNENKIAVGKSR